ncbi:hypothetical protein [Curtobacterium sp. Curtsp57]|uniref:hypothetical protein n=1 Tax=Curtobacterium sp. Curtsp57 TaxID=3243047 RepID=UPI0039B5416C
MTTLIYGGQSYEIDGRVNIDDFTSLGYKRLPLVGGGTAVFATGEGIHAVVIEDKPKGRAAGF